MFGKIKDKLKGVFASSEEVVEKNPDEIIEVEEDLKEEKDIKKQKEIQNKLGELEEIEDEILEESKEEKKGFLSRVFGSKKDEEETDELENIENEMLEKVSKEEKVAIKEKKDLSEYEIKENQEIIEDKIKSEEIEEKETVKEIEEVKIKTDFVEKKLEKEQKKEIIENTEEIKEESKEEKKGFFSKTFKKLKSKTITNTDFEKIWIELELFLLEINIAYEIVEKIETSLRENLIGNSFDRFNLTKRIREVLEDEVENVLKSRESNLIDKIKQINDSGDIAKIMILGVNGTGKTTTIAKIVNLFQKKELSVVVAAADTFRAAAVEQLDEHSKKLNFKLIKHKGGSDPAAVAFDAIEHAEAKKLNVVLIDTAGRMPNNSNLMIELQKIKRVSKSNLAIFVGDSISGNDLIDQINLFDKGVEIDGVMLTKVDTDEKPGSIVTTAYSIDKPIFYLGIGQRYNDLLKFNAKEIAHKLFSID